MKKLCSIVLFCALLISFSMRAEAFTSVKTVILPLQDTAAYHSKEVDQLVADRLRDHFRYPFYDKDFVAWQDAALLPGKKITDQENMAALAKAREAGLVVGVELVTAKVKMRQSAFASWECDTYLDTEVEVAVRIYSAGDGVYRSWPAQLSREEVMTVNSGVKAAVEELLEKLLKELPYQRLAKVE